MVVNADRVRLWMFPLGHTPEMLTDQRTERIGIGISISRTQIHVNVTLAGEVVLVDQVRGGAELNERRH